MVESVAKEVLSRYWNGQLPVDTIYIASRVGALTMPRDIGEVSGMIELMSGDVPVISYNEKESLERRRFTVAHELGHLILKHLTRESSFFQDTIQDIRSYRVSKEEQDASEFALHLLMPSDVLRKAVLLKGITSIEKLSAIFEVTEVDMLTKLRLIGLIK